MDTQRVCLKRMEKDAKQKLVEDLIQKAPIKFIQDFMLNEHAFLNRPKQTYWHGRD